MHMQPYLYFNGHCDDALAFYGEAIGAKASVLTRYRDNPGIPVAAGSEDKVLHAEIKIGDAIILASDADSSGELDFRGFSLTLTAERSAEAEALFTALSDGGAIQVPISPTSFASRFGMVSDRFGVLWTVIAYEGQTPG